MILTESFTYIGFVLFDLEKVPNLIYAHRVSLFAALHSFLYTDSGTYVQSLPAHLPCVNTWLIVAFHTHIYLLPLPSIGISPTDARMVGKISTEAIIAIAALVVTIPSAVAIIGPFVWQWYSRRARQRQTHPSMEDGMYNLPCCAKIIVAA